jgi:hypothetical protein
MHPIAKGRRGVLHSLDCPVDAWAALVDAIQLGAEAAIV